MQVEFEKQVFKIKEQQRAREEEIEGGWYTEERMGKDLGYSSMLEHILVISFRTVFWKSPFFIMVRFFCPKASHVFSVPC